MAANMTHMTHEHGNRKTMRQRTAHDLRRQAAEMSEDIEDLSAHVAERGDRVGWDDLMVQNGLHVLEGLRHKQAQLIAEARALGTTFMFG